MKKNKEDALATVSDFKQVFDNPVGRKVLRNLMHFAGFDRINYVPGDIYGMVFNEGARNIVLHIVKNLKYDLKKLEKELTEIEETQNE